MADNNLSSPYTGTSGNAVPSFIALVGGKNGSSQTKALSLDSSDYLNVNVAAGGTSGTQYADGAAAATPTGNQINWNDSGTQRAVSIAKALPIAQQGNTGVGDDTATITTAGTAVQLPSHTCKRAYISSHESNGGTVLVGGSTVVAALVGRRGHPIFPTTGDWFTVSNTNLLYADSTVSGDKIVIFYES